MALQLQVRSVDGAVFWVETDLTATIGSIKQSIMNARGIDVIMQKLICAGKLLGDESTPEMCGITERDFLVLVTAKPRPPSLVSTGAPLPSSYQSHLHAAGDPGVEDDGDDGEEGQDLPNELVDEGEGEGEGEEDGDDADDADDGDDGDGADGVDEVARLVEMGFDAHEADQALRLSCNDARRALALLRSGRVSAGEEAVRALQDRLRSLPAFHALQQVVRVDPQIMVRRSPARCSSPARRPHLHCGAQLSCAFDPAAAVWQLVLNTEAMRFEDPKSEQLLGEPGSESVSAEVSQEREAVEKAFWDACTLELTNVPPVYERTLQLVQEVGLMRRLGHTQPCPARPGSSAPHPLDGLM